MRLHRVEIEQFGPFAERVVIDMDEVTRQGLFLLHGQTGAGKTSVLDAMCFALYGSVPGSRAKTERLTSDHGSGPNGPRVVCEFSAAGRRLEVTRSPQWLRPKARGSGVTTQPAKVVVRELVGGAWVARTDRSDEAGLLLDGVLGMRKDQFTQVVLLPQGDFAAFLRCGPDERKTLLEKLFGTARFADVETWLAERRNEARTTLQSADHRRAELLARIDEHASALEGYDPQLLAEAESGRGGDASGFCEHWRQVARGQSELLTASVHAAEEEVRTRRAAHTRAVRRAEQVDTLAELVAEQVRLDAREPLIGAARQNLVSAERAEMVRGRLESVHTAEADLRRALRGLTRARAALTEVVALGATPHHEQTVDDSAPTLFELGAVGEQHCDTTTTVSRGSTPLIDLAVEQLPGEISIRRKLLGVLEELEELQDEVDADRAAQAEAGQRIDELGVELGRADTRRDCIAVDLGRVQAELAHARSTCGTVDACEDSLQRAEDRLRAATEVARLTPLVAEAAAAAATAKVAGLDARERYLTLFAERLDGMAGELAARLVSDEPCPVCGSAQHPAPAPQAVVPTEARLALARDAAERAGQAAEEAAEHAGRLTRDLAAAAAVSSGFDPDTARAEVAVARRARDEVRACVARVPELVGRLQQLTDEQDELVAGADQLRDAVRAEQERRTVLATRLRDRATRLHRAAGGFPSVHDRVRAVTAEVSLLERVVAWHDTHRAAAATVDVARVEAEKDCRRVGLASLGEAAQALLGPGERSRLADLVGAHDRARTVLSARIGAPQLRQVCADLGLPDPTHLGLLPHPTDPGLPHPTDPGLPDAGDTGDAGTALDPALDTRLMAQHRVAELAAAARSGTESAWEALEAADAELARLRARSTVVQGVAASLQELGAALVSHETETGPLRDRHDLLAELAGTAQGMSASNLTRTRLSAYVLQARLDEVARAASVRLQSMSQGRYSLVHSTAKAKGNVRGGLGLRVMDTWTSRDRDTASLSGGESFLASMALALGLADVVQHESGGCAIETLFIDEGFGTLDEETLELVMECLDQLREGGRSVGVVSHVAELRARIPNQVHVLKGRAGSTVRVHEALAS